MTRDLADLGSRTIAAGPRPVYCVVASTHRRFDIADEVAEGLFSHCGVTLDLGVEPDWLDTALPVDEEWRIEWSKFPWGLDLAHEYERSGKTRYLDAWQRLVASWIERVPAGHDTSDVAARRLLSWIYAWNVFARSTAFRGLDNGLEAALVRSIGAQTTYIRGHLTPERNHRTLELYSLLVVALALPGLDPDGSLASFAMEELARNAEADLLPDGVHRELSTHYHLIVLRSYLGAIENARLFGVELPEGFAERVELACEFGAHCHRPDGEIPALSDADGGGYQDTILLAADLFGREDFRWIATAGAEGIPPEARSTSFPSGGYFVQRSGWGDGSTPFDEERFLIFDCGPVGDGGHGHYDALSVEMAAGGRPLIVDPGRFTYSEEGPNWRRWFKGTAAHNTVTVDGLDQVVYRRGKPKDPLPETRLLGQWSCPGLEIVAGAVMSACYDAVHRRRVAFVRDLYWLVEDVLEAPTPHWYDLRFHLAPDALGRLSLGARASGQSLIEVPGLGLVIDGADAVELELGWLSRSYGHKGRAPIVNARAHGRTASFVTLVYPAAPGEEIPSLVVHRDAGAAEIVGTSGVVRDVIALDQVGVR